MTSDVIEKMRDRKKNERRGDSACMYQNTYTFVKIFKKWYPNFNSYIINRIPILIF
jgi:hypothetical protein